MDLQAVKISSYLCFRNNLAYMDQKIIVIIAGHLGISEHQVVNTINLLNDGATIPFIARYRKERTGSLDEVQVLQIKELADKYTDLEKRKETVTKTIDEQG